MDTRRKTNKVIIGVNNCFIFDLFEPKSEKIKYCRRKYYTDIIFPLKYIIVDDVFNISFTSPLLMVHVHLSELRNPSYDNHGVTALLNSVCIIFAGNENTICGIRTSGRN